MISLGFLRSVSVVSLGMSLAAAAFFALSYALRVKRAASIGAGNYRPRLSYLLELGSLALMALAMLRPYRGFEDIRVKSQGRDIIAAVDVSQSMLAKDASPNRLEFAQRKLIDLINLLERSGGGDRVGIILFAGQGYVFCPLTTDYRVARTFAQSIEPSLIGAAGTDLNLMLQVAEGAAQSVQAQNPQLLILSDGEDLTLAAPTIPANLKVSAIGIGSTDGVPIEASQGTYLKDAEGSMVITRLREDLLRPLTKLGGGRYQKASFDDADLRSVLAVNPGSESAIRESGNIRSYREIGPYFLWPVLGVLLVLYAMGKQRLLLPLVIGAILLHGPQDARANPISEQALYEGYKAYQRGDYAGAKAFFEARTKEAPADLKALEALGSTEYKLGNFEQAERLFEELVAKGKDGRTLFDGYYNLGNSRLFSKNYRGAIQSYEKALKIKENDERATTNLEIARRLLEQQEQQQSSSSQSASSAPSAGQSASSTSSESQSPRGSHSSQSASAGSQEGRSSAESQSAHSQNTSGENDSAGASSKGAGSSAGSNSSAHSLGGNESDSRVSEGSSSAAFSQGGDGSAFSSSSSEKDSAQAAPASSAAASSQSVSEQTEIGYSPKQHYDPEELRQEEAKAWLNALPEAPVLLMKKGRGKKDSAGQTW